MEKKYSRFDLFRYAKFLKRNSTLKNNLKTIERFTNGHPPLTEEEKYNNIKEILGLKN